jgi:uncharacterized membrane protein
LSSLSFRRGLRLRDREFRGLGGWSGKPLHPPLAAVALGSVVVATVLDVVSTAIGSGTLGRELYRAGTFALMVGQVGLALAVLTGWWDRRRLTRKYTVVRRVANAHGLTMLCMAGANVVDIIVRRGVYPDARHSPVPVLLITIVVALFALIGGTLGGELTFDFGLGVEPNDAPSTRGGTA